jgi:Rieske 2Fe-2S family protein
LPSFYYTSPGVYALELENIFYSRWLVACHSSQLGNAGDVLPMTVGQKSIFLVRANDGSIKAFYNVCPHRGTRLLSTSENTKRIQCPYHGWTYRLDGELIGCPDAKEYGDDFRRDEYSLYPVRSETWGGFVWVNLDPEAIPLTTYLGDFTDRFAKYRMEEMRWIGTIGAYDVESNWKVVIENTNECYHCPTVHPETLKPYYRDHVPIDEGELHGTYSLLQWRNFVKTNPDREWNHALSSRILGLDEIESASLQLPTVFPNCQFNISPAWCMTLIAWPTGPRTSRVLLNLYAHSWPGSADGYTREFEWLDFINRQDWVICKLQQEGFQSDVFAGSKFNRLEAVVRRFQRLYREAIKHADGTDLGVDDGLGPQ